MWVRVDNIALLNFCKVRAMLVKMFELHFDANKLEWKLQLGIQKLPEKQRLQTTVRAAIRCRHCVPDECWPWR